MNKYAVIYTMIDMEKNVEHRPKHIEFLTSLLREGKIESGWKFPDYQNGKLQGILICPANSKEEVEQWFEQDPVIESGARTFEVRDAQYMAIKV